MQIWKLQTLIMSYTTGVCRSYTIFLAEIRNTEIQDLNLQGHNAVRKICLFAKYSLINKNQKHAYILLT